MSGLVLTSPSASALPTMKADDVLRRTLPGPPVGIRQFVTETDEMALYVEVYDNRTSSPHDVAIRTSVTADEGTVVFESNEHRRTTDAGLKGGVFSCSVRIPTRGIPPGKYALRVEARASLNEAMTAARDVPITIVTPNH